MDNLDASSCSPPTTSGSANSTSKRPLSALEEPTLDAWVENKEKKILKAIENWTRAESSIRMRPKFFPLYTADERSDKNLRYNLSLVYKDYGPIDLRYEGCDTLAEHWVSGWDPRFGSRDAVQRFVLSVRMGERLPGQSPVLDRLAAEIQADSDEEKNKGKSDDTPDSDEGKDEEEDHEGVDSDGENDQDILDQGLTDQDIANFEEGLNEESDSERAGWVDVTSGGVDDGDWTKSDKRVAMVKDAGRILLEGFRKL